MIMKKKIIFPVIERIIISLKWNGNTPYEFIKIFLIFKSAFSYVFPEACSKGQFEIIQEFYPDDQIGSDSLGK